MEIFFIRHFQANAFFKNIQSNFISCAVINKKINLTHIVNKLLLL